MIIKTKYGEMIITEEIAKRMQNLLKHTDTTPENAGFAGELYYAIEVSLRKKNRGKIYYKGYVIKDVTPFDDSQRCYEIYKCRELVTDSKDYVETVVGTLEFTLNYIDTYLL